MRIEYCVDKNVSLCFFESYSGALCGNSISPELMDYTLIPHNWKEHINHRGISWNFQSVLGSGIIPGGKEKDRARQAVFPTPRILFEKDPEEEKPHFDYTVPQKIPCETRWK